MKQSLIRCAAIFSCVIGLSGCSTLNEFAVTPDKGQPARFDGVRDVYKEGWPLNIVFIHGMGDYSNDDPTPLIHRMQESFPGLRPYGSEIYSLFQKDKVDLGFMKTNRTRSDDGSRSINYHTIYWQKVVEPKKDKLEEDQEHRNTQYRLARMESFKSGLLNNGIADAALYMGDYAHLMREPLRQAILKINDIDLCADTFTATTDLPCSKRNANNVFITFSLGSAMLFDTLEEMKKGTPSEQQAAKRINSRARLLFMLANQMPLLALSRESELESTVHTKSSQPDAMSAYIMGQSRPKKVTPRPRVIAISDPNDLLSYPVLDAWREKHPGEFINVTTSVARTAYYLPGVGAFINPKKAHTGYGSDDRVQELIINGYTRDTSTQDK